jgi:hypothetical protein
VAEEPTANALVKIATAVKIVFVIPATVVRGFSRPKLEVTNDGKG